MTQPAGIFIGIVVVVAVVAGYVTALRRESGAWFAWTLLISILVTIGTFADVLFLPWLDFDNGLALIYFAIAVWLPAFVVAPIVTGVILSIRSNRRDADE